VARRTPGGIASRAPESESALLKDRSRHRGIGGDKTASLSGVSLTQTDREGQGETPGCGQIAVKTWDSAAGLEAAVYKVMCKAKDREAVVRMLFPAWSPDAIQNLFCPYNLWTLLEEGRFEDIAFAPSAEEQDVTPIPYGTEPAHA